MKKVSSHLQVLFEILTYKIFYFMVTYFSLKSLLFHGNLISGALLLPAFRQKVSNILDIIQTEATKFYKLNVLKSFIFFIAYFMGNLKVYIYRI